jgi:hypothetical protein
MKYIELQIKSEQFSHIRLGHPSINALRLHVTLKQIPC